MVTAKTPYKSKNAKECKDRSIFAREKNLSQTSLEEIHASVSESGFIDEKQLLARLPVSRGTLANWKAKGILPFIKIGRRCLYDWASVQGALLRRQRGGQS